MLCRRADIFFTPAVVVGHLTLADAATPLPWGAQPVGLGHRINGGPKHVTLADLRGRNHGVNADYIVTACNNYPAALKEIARLHRRIEVLEASLRIAAPMLLEGI